MTERIFVCFDKNMEKRVFNLKPLAENVAVGEIEEYINVKALQPLVAVINKDK